MYVGIVPNVAFAIWFNFIHTQTDFTVTKNRALRKLYFTVLMYAGNR